MTQPESQAGHHPTVQWSIWPWRGWPILLMLAFLWFPFDWLATVWPVFGEPFRLVFHNAHDHLIGHAIFFFVVGLLALWYVPALRRRPFLYILGVVAAALVQETIQAIFRGQIPRYTDFNAFAGDALGSTLAFALWLASDYVRRRRASRSLG